MTGQGGAVLNLGTLTVSDSTLTSNSALVGTSFVGPVQFGGGIYNVGTLTITGSTLSGNTANGGGAIQNGDIIAGFVTGNPGRHADDQRQHPVRQPGHRNQRISDWRGRRRHLQLDHDDGHQLHPVATTPPRVNLEQAAASTTTAAISTCRQ